MSSCGASGCDHFILSPCFLSSNQGKAHDQQLADHEEGEPGKGGIGKAVGVETDPKHVGSEPGPAGHDVTEDRHDHHAALPDHAAPPGMQNNCIPDDYQKSSIFLGIPSPEPSPRLVSPDATENRPDKTGEGGEADDAVDHSPHGVGCLFWNASEKVPEQVIDCDRSSQEGGRVTQCDHDDMSGEPEVAVQDSPHHLERVSCQ